MTRLKVDTWDPEYATSFEAIDLDPDDATPAARQVERETWAPIVPDASPAGLRIGFWAASVRVHQMVLSAAQFSWRNLQ